MKKEKQREEKERKAIEAIMGTGEEVDVNEGSKEIEKIMKRLYNSFKVRMRRRCP